MANCPQCQQTVSSDAMVCPFCRAELKAFGHPGMPLHRAARDRFLCDDCTYHLDDSCNFPKRPYAKDCTLYENHQTAVQAKQQQAMLLAQQRSWFHWAKRHLGWFLLLGLVVISVVIALLR